MKVQLERTFPMPAGPAATWELLADVESVAACMPGATITERIDARHYKGTVTVKLGPATLSFRGDMEVRELDPEHRTLLLGAKGTDTSGASAASLDLKATVRGAGDGTSTLTGTCEATVNGRAATFGGRMMDAVAEQILGQFAVNFAARLPAREPPGPEAGQSATQAASPDPQPPPATPLNALALLWAVIRGWLRGLFAKRTA